VHIGPDKGTRSRKFTLSSVKVKESRLDGYFKTLLSKEKSLVGYLTVTFMNAIKIYTKDLLLNGSSGAGRKYQTTGDKVFLGITHCCDPLVFEDRYD
jgi:hypothetical protein